MSKYMLLYVGPPTPPDASHEAWPGWFAKLGERLVDRGSPLGNRVAVRSDGSTATGAVRVNGYSIIEAEDLGDALRHVKDHPYLAAGPDYTVEVCALP